MRHEIEEYCVYTYLDIHTTPAGGFNDLLLGSTANQRRFGPDVKNQYYDIVSTPKWKGWKLKMMGNPWPQESWHCFAVACFFGG